jgi:hypothetical protein
MCVGGTQRVLPHYVFILPAVKAEYVVNYNRR